MQIRFEQENWVGEKKPVIVRVFAGQAPLDSVPVESLERRGRTIDDMKTAFLAAAAPSAQGEAANTPENRERIRAIARGNLDLPVPRR